MFVRLFACVCVCVYARSGALAVGGAFGRSRARLVALSGRWSLGAVYHRAFKFRSIHFLADRVTRLGIHRKMTVEFAQRSFSRSTSGKGNGVNKVEHSISGRRFLSLSLSRSDVSENNLNPSKTVRTAVPFEHKLLEN